jgi:hypothetical protein
MVVVGSTPFVGSEMRAVRFFQSSAEGSTGLFVSCAPEEWAYCSQTGQRVLSASPGKTSFSPVLLIVDTVDGWVTLSPAINSALSARARENRGDGLRSVNISRLATPPLPLASLFPSSLPLTLPHPLEFMVAIPLL